MIPTVAPDQVFSTFDQKAVLKVCGVGGGGGNAVDRMIDSQMTGVQFIAINTDAQALKKSKAEIRLQIGSSLSGGLGAGAKPEVGAQACEEDRDKVREVLRGADLVFLTAGLGGGTGTGAAPIVAEEAGASGALTVAIVTLPFSFEGEERMNNALKGLEELRKHVDTLIVVPNDRIAELSHTNTSLLDAFRHGDEVLHNGVRAISELITLPGLINVDFADVRTIMQSKGRALMGIGIAQGEDRAVRAAREAIDCPLLEQSDIHGARGVIVNVRGGSDIRMREVQDAINYVKSNASPDANIIWGVAPENEERDDFQVTVIAAGFPNRDAAEYRTKGRSVAQDILTPAPPAPRPAPMPAPEQPAAAPAAAAPQAPVQNAQQKSEAPRAEAPRPQPAQAPVAAAKPAAKPEPPAKAPQQLDLPSGSSNFTTVFSSGATPEEDDMRIPAYMRQQPKKQ
jgi:cell division protein FtsZ